MRAIILGILISIVCTIAHANQLFIFFINGINTTPDEADFSLSKLSAIADVDSPEVNWNVLYNATHGIVRSDLWDVLKQRRQERYRLDYLTYKKNNPTHSLEDFLSDKQAVGRNLGDLVEQFHEHIPNPSVNTYVVIISHSQGNQYANQLWDYLVNAEGFPRSHIALIGIASPTGIGKGNHFLYVTADNDRIINMARILPGKILPANAHIENCEGFTCHGLIGDYLGDKSIRSIICNHIGSFMHLWINTRPIC